MAPPFSPPLPWPENWPVHRPSVRPAHTTSCRSTSSPLSLSSTNSQMGWGTEENVSATAASSSRIWTCQCLWTFQTTANPTSPARSPWETCSHAAVASALMFSRAGLEVVVRWNGLGCAQTGLGKSGSALLPCLTSLIPFSSLRESGHRSQEWGTKWHSGQDFLKVLCLGPGPYTRARI